MKFDQVWRVRKFLPDRFGQRCRIVVLGTRMQSALVEFADGYRVVTIRWFVRAATIDDDRQPGLFDN